jgi:ABC-2 type transport system ATP-binding protein
VQAVIAQSNITTWIAEEGDLSALAREFRGRRGVEQVVPFGNTLHVSGTEAELLGETIAGLRDHPEYRWALGRPGLEDVFIQLMQRASAKQ